MLESSCEAASAMVSCGADVDRAEASGAAGAGSMAALSPSSTKRNSATAPATKGDAARRLLGDDLGISFSSCVDACEVGPCLGGPAPAVMDLTVGLVTGRVQPGGPASAGGCDRRS